MKSRANDIEALRAVARLAGAIVLEAPAKPTKHSVYVRAELIRKLTAALTEAGFDMVAARQRYTRDLRETEIKSGRELERKRMAFRHQLQTWTESESGRVILYGTTPTREHVNKAAREYLAASGRARNADAITDDEALAIANEIEAAGFPDDNRADEEALEPQS